MIETLVLRFGQIEAFFCVVGLVLQLLTLAALAAVHAVQS